MLDKSAAIAADLMTRKVVTVHPEISVAEAVRLMAVSEVSSQAVLDTQGQVVGMISDGDLVRWFGELIRDTERLPADSGAAIFKALWRAEETERVAGLMARNVVAIPETMPAREVAALMHTRRVKRLPALQEGNLVGVIARSDLVWALVAELQDTLGVEPDADDEGNEPQVEQDREPADARVLRNRALRRRRSSDEPRH